MVVKVNALFRGRDSAFLSLPSTDGSAIDRADQEQF
jgi:hypothetical protein